MSTNAIEAAIYRINTEKYARTEFLENPGRFLKRFSVSQIEADEIIKFDVRSLQNRGVNPLLTYGLWIQASPGKSRKSYLKQLKTEGTSVNG